MKFYKVPVNLVTPEALRTMTGVEGTFLNPILDENDNWIVSKEEWEGAEFQYLKTEYPDIATAFEEIDTNPKQYPQYLGVE